MWIAFPIAYQDFHFVLTSTDTVNWNVTTTKIPFYFSGSVSNSFKNINGKWLGVGDNGCIVNYANNVFTAKQISSYPYSLTDITFSQTQQKYFITSRYGIAVCDVNFVCTPLSLPTATPLRSIAKSKTTFVAVGDGGNILSSEN